MNHPASCTCRACEAAYQQLKAQNKRDFQALKNAQFSRNPAMKFFEKIGIAIFGEPRNEHER